MEVACQLHAEPGGALPDWLANRAAKAAYQTLVNLRQIVQRPQYQTIRLPFIDEPP